MLMLHDVKPYFGGFQRISYSKAEKRLPYEIYEVSAQRISIGGYFEQ